MRLAHHLLRHTSGIFHFRLVVPADLRQALGKKIIKVSLRTRDPVEARAYAYALGARYAHAISEARGGQMGNRTNDYLSRISKFEITPQPDGRYALKTDGSPQDNDAGLRALAMLTAAPVTPPASAAPTPPSPALLADVHQQLLAAFSTPPTPKGPTLQEAFDLYVEVEVRNLKKDTWQQRERAMRSFISHVGGHPSLLVIAFAAFYDLAACLLSLWIVGRRPIEEPQKSGLWASLTVIFHAGILLGAVMLLLLGLLYARVYWRGFF